MLRDARMSNLTPIYRNFGREPFLGISILRSLQCCAPLDIGQRERRFRPAAVSVMLTLSDASRSNDGRSVCRSPQSKNNAQPAQWEKLSGLVDRLRSEHGGKAMLLGAHEDVRGWYLRATIAFGRIPDKADFTARPSRDEDTHFCKVSVR